MPNEEHLAILKQGVNAWNDWREGNPTIRPDLHEAILHGAILRGPDLGGPSVRGVNFRGSNLNKAEFVGADLRCADLSEANLSEASLVGANLSQANLEGANLEGANAIEASFQWARLGQANLTGASFHRANLVGAKFPGANLRGTDLSETNLFRANLHGAILRGANLYGANLREAILSEANLGGANLELATLVQTVLTGATLTGAKVYGVSAWSLDLTKVKDQTNLSITAGGEPEITVDNLEVAQFIYLLLNNEKIRDVIDTIGKKGVLILGRFTPERKDILDAIRDELRRLDYVPMMFDFEKPTQRDFTETVKVLAGLSRFIIADITNPRSSPLELQATMPDYMIPFVPIIQEDEEPFSMFQDLQGKYGDWVLDVLKYDSAANLIAVLERAVVAPALVLEDRLLTRKTEQIRSRHVQDYA